MGWPQKTGHSQTHPHQTVPPPLHEEAQPGCRFLGMNKPKNRGNGKAHHPPEPERQTQKAHLAPQNTRDANRRAKSASDGTTSGARGTNRKAPPSTNRSRLKPYLSLGWVMCGGTLRANHAASPKHIKVQNQLGIPKNSICTGYASGLVRVSRGERGHASKESH